MALLGHVRTLNLRTAARANTRSAVGVWKVITTFFQRGHCQRGCATNSTKLGQFQSEMRLQSQLVCQEFRAVYLTAFPEAMLLQGEVPELMLAGIWLACVIGDAPHAPRRA